MARRRASALAAAALLGSVAGCGHNDGIKTVVGCSQTGAFTWQHVTYYPARWSGRSGPRPGKRLADGVDEPCSTGEKPRAVVVHALRGVPPRFAIYATTLPRTHVYLAPGYLIQLGPPGLRRHVFTAAMDRAARHLSGCHPRRMYVGRVVATPGNYAFLITPPRKQLDITVTTQTRVRGLTRNGYPYVQEDDHIVVAGRRCVGLNGASTVVAQTITRAPAP